MSFRLKKIIQLLGQARQSQSGYAILFVGMFLAIVLFWAFTINDIVLSRRNFEYEVVDTRASYYDNVINSVQAFYVTESGMEKALNDLYLQTPEGSLSTNPNNFCFDELNGGGPTNWYRASDGQLLSQPISESAYCHSYDGVNNLLYVFGQYATPQGDTIFRTIRSSDNPVFIDCYGDGEYNPPNPDCMAARWFGHSDWQREWW